MKKRTSGIFILSIGVLLLSWLALTVESPREALSYPPGVGILRKSKNCLNCHLSNAPWKDDENTIIDILEKETKKSLKQYGRLGFEPVLQQYQSKKEKKEK